MLSFNFHASQTTCSNLKQISKNGGNYMIDHAVVSAVKLCEMNPFKQWIYSKEEMYQKVWTLHRVEDGWLQNMQYNTWKSNQVNSHKIYAAH